MRPFTRESAEEETLVREAKRENGTEKRWGKPVIRISLFMRHTLWPAGVTREFTLASVIDSTFLRRKSNRVEGGIWGSGWRIRLFVNVMIILTSKRSRGLKRRFLHSVPLFERALLLPGLLPLALSVYAGVSAYSILAKGNERKIAYRRCNTVLFCKLATLGTLCIVCWRSSLFYYITPAVAFPEAILQPSPLHNENNNNTNNTAASGLFVDWSGRPRIYSEPEIQTEICCWGKTSGFVIRRPLRSATLREFSLLKEVEGFCWLFFWSEWAREQEIGRELDICLKVGPLCWVADCVRGSHEAHSQLQIGLVPEWEVSAAREMRIANPVRVFSKWGLASALQMDGLPLSFCHILLFLWLMRANEETRPLPDWNTPRALLRNECGQCQCAKITLNQPYFSLLTRQIRLE